MKNLKEIVISTTRKKYEYLYDKKGLDYDILYDIPSLPKNAVVTALVQYGEFLSHVGKGHKLVLIGENDTWPLEDYVDLAGEEMFLARKCKTDGLTYNDLKGIEAVCNDYLRVRLDSKTEKKILNLFPKQFHGIGSKAIIELALRYLNTSEWCRIEEKSIGFEEKNQRHSIRNEVDYGPYDGY